VPKKLGPRIHIHKDMIFLYDPFWLEREDGTYLVDWAEREDVDKIKKYLKGKENPATVFHLFSFPVHRVSSIRNFPPHLGLSPDLQRGWVWNGAHQFRLIEGLPALWPQLRQKAGVETLYHHALPASVSTLLTGRLGETETDEQNTSPDAR